MKRTEKNSFYCWKGDILFKNCAMYIIGQLFTCSLTISIVLCVIQNWRVWYHAIVLSTWCSVKEYFLKVDPILRGYYWV